MSESVELSVRQRLGRCDSDCANRSIVCHAMALRLTPPWAAQPRALVALHVFNESSMGLCSLTTFTAPNGRRLAPHNVAPRPLGLPIRARVRTRGWPIGTHARENHHEPADEKHNRSKVCDTAEGNVYGRCPQRPALVGDHLVRGAGAHRVRAPSQGCCAPSIRGARKRTEQPLRARLVVRHWASAPPMATRSCAAKGNERHVKHPIV